MADKLTDDAFFELMEPALPEMAAWEVERANVLKAEKVAELANPKNWDWMKVVPPATVHPLGRGKSEFQQYLQRFIDQMDELRKAGGDELTLDDEHPASVYGAKIKLILETQSLTTQAQQTIADAAKDLNNQWGRNTQPVPSPQPWPTSRAQVPWPNGSGPLSDVGPLSDIGGLGGMSSAWGSWGGNVGKNR